MRYLAAVFILIGTLILGGIGVDSLQARDMVSTEQVAEGRDDDPFASTLPALGGIAIVSGLMMIAASLKCRP